MEQKKQIESPQDRLTTWLITFSCLCLILQIYAMPRNNTRFMSLANMTMLFIWLGVGGVSVVKRFVNRLPGYLFCVVWLLVFIIFSLMFSVLTAGGSITANITAIVNFFALPIMLLYAAIYHIPERAKKIILVMNVLLSWVFIDLYFSGYRNAYTNYYGTTNIGALTLGFSNPNQTAMFLFACAVVLGVSVFYFKSMIIRLGVTLDLVFICKMLFDTESRTAFLAILVFSALVALSFKRRLTNKWILYAMVAPAVYAACALFLRAYFGDVTFLGESIFTGRERIYDRYLTNLNLINFMMGDFGKFRFDNLHNGYISIVATAGIFSLINFIIFLRRGLERNLVRLGQTRYSKVAFIGFLATIIYSSSEAAFFVGGSTYAYMIFVVYLLFSQPYVELDYK